MPSSISFITQAKSMINARDLKTIVLSASKVRKEYTLKYRGVRITAANQLASITPELYRLNLEVIWGLSILVISIFSQMAILP
jgi:hypothetical protein